MSNQDYYFISAMRQFGGGFVSALAGAWEMADAKNRDRLTRAFPEMVIEYGPGSKFFNAVEAD